MIYDIKDFLKKIFDSRLFVLCIVMILLTSILLGRVFQLQIINGAYYQNNFILKIEKDLDIKATRGNIYDCNGELLAYNELAYAVTITDTGSYKNNTVKNEQLNKQLAQIIEKIHENGDSIFNELPIAYNSEEDSYEYTISGFSLKRFLADLFGQKSYDDLKYNEKYGFNEATATAEEIMNYLYSKTQYGVDLEAYSKNTAYEIAVIRFSMNQNRYSRYKSTIIAKDVSDQTVAYINEHSDELVGVLIEEDTIRKYNYSEYFASLIGYTGKISTDEYETLSKQDDTYTTNDYVGRIGLEKYYESYLRGTNGDKKVLIDNLGRVVEELSTKDSVSGDDLYLSIDANLQKTTYLLLEQEIAGILYDSIQKGNVPMKDVYFALINNNIIDIRHFSKQDASSRETSLYNQFVASQNNSIQMVSNELNSSSPTINNNMSEEMLDYFTYVISLLKSNDILLTSEIDETDETYNNWKNGTLSPRDYLKYCISKQWIDINQLNVDQKYADTSEVYNTLCQYVLDQLANDRAFSKLVYKYMIEANMVNITDLCLILYDQGVFPYDEEKVSGLENGTIGPSSFLLDKIKNIELTPAQIGLEPCTGSTVLTDVNTGQIKALVSYPGYDNNKLANSVDADYYAKLTESLANPLYNYATQEQTAPGSTFKMVSATAGLAENVIDTSTLINCTGTFTEVSNKPRCWRRSGHGPLNVSDAIKESCNVYFYTVGFKLAQMDSGVYDDPVGIAKIQKYASIYGLDQPTGVEIVENTSKIATQYPVMAAIGQSNNNITTIALSRYVTAVSTGKLYNYQLMNKIVDANGNVVDEYSAESQDISSTLNQQQWDSIHSGMQKVCEAMDNYKTFPIVVAGKTGTAQQEDHPNHALFVGYAPYDNPQISIATRIAYGHSSHNAADVSRNILAYYFNTEDASALVDGVAEDANGTSSNND